MHVLVSRLNVIASFFFYSEAGSSLCHDLPSFRHLTGSINQLKQTWVQHRTAVVNWHFGYQQEVKNLALLIIPRLELLIVHIYGHIFGTVSNQ